MIKVNGIVLSSMPVGEYDRRVVLLTKELGKISAFARRARKANSQLMGVCNAFIYGEFDIYLGRSSYTINHAVATEYFTNVTTDIDKMMMGTYFLEVAGFFSQENNDEKERLLLLYRTLQVTGAGSKSLELIRSIYEYRTMVINGVYPNLFECSVCKGKDNLIALNNNLEGVKCKSCTIDGYDECRPINASTLYALQYVMSSTINKLFSFELTPDVEEEFIRTVERFKLKYLDYEFKSALFLKL